jgi:1-acyl-sn-glycerol-3-phosphate acyltransferase
VEYRDTSLRLDPWRATRLDLGAAPGSRRRAMLRALLVASCGAVRVEGRERIERAPAGSIFALSHHGTWESLLAPATLVALRRGRPIRFLVDWMFAELPFTSWLVREIDPIPVYGKRARFGLGERLRRGPAGFDPILEAAATLEGGGDVGLYPEGTRRGAVESLSRLRRGVVRLASASGAPIVPIGVELPACRRLGRKPRIGRVVLRAGEPVRATEAGGERELLNRLAAELASLSNKLPPAEATREPRERRAA